MHPHGPGWKVLGESCKVEVRGEHSLAPGSCAGPCDDEDEVDDDDDDDDDDDEVDDDGVDLRNLQMVRPCPGS